MDVSDLLKGVVKGMVCTMNAHLFWKTFLDKEKTTRRCDKHKGHFRNK